MNKHRGSYWKTLVLGGLALLLTACGGPRTLRLPGGAMGYALAFAPAGDALMVLYHTDGSDTVECRELPGGRVRWRVKGLPGTGVAFAPDGSEVAVYSDNRLLFYGTDDGKSQGEIDLMPKQRLGYQDPLYGVFHIRYLPDGRLALVTYHRDRYFLETWNRDGTPAGEPVLMSDFGNPSWWRPFTRDGKQVAYAKHDTLSIVDVTTGEHRGWDLSGELPEETYISTLAFSPDGHEVAVGLSHIGDLWNEPLPDPMMMRIDAATGEVLAGYALPSNTPAGETVVSLAYSPDGRFLAATTLDAKALLLYDLSGADEEPQTLCQGDGCCRHFPLFSPDGRTLATVCDRRVALWEVAP